MSIPGLAAPSGNVRKRMQDQRTRDTAPELSLRKELWRRGLRYRLQVALISERRKHDIVFVAPRVVVDVRGCFWHGCPEHLVVPTANRQWWLAKIEANRRRDADTVQRLIAAGWEPIIVWEHEDVVHAADRVERRVKESSRQGSNPSGSAR